MAAPKKEAVMPDIRDELYTQEEAAAQGDWTLHTLKKWRWLRVGPPYIRIGRRVFYPKAKFREWFLRHEQKASAA
jgi:hypothetical protein